MKKRRENKAKPGTEEARRQRYEQETKELVGNKEHLYKLTHEVDLYFEQANGMTEIYFIFKDKIAGASLIRIRYLNPKDFNILSGLINKSITAGLHDRIIAVREIKKLLEI